MQRNHCCFVSVDGMGCPYEATRNIQFGDAPDDYTHSCETHLAEMAQIHNYPFVCITSLVRASAEIASAIADDLVKVRDIARVTHEANRAYCHSIGDDSQLSWQDAPKWQLDSAMRGVQFALLHPDATPENQHESWACDKIADGWTYGDIKDADKKEHPCLVPYSQLPSAQKVKDALFRNIVMAFIQDEE